MKGGRLIIVVVAALGGASAWAQITVDPTRPAVGIAVEEPEGGGSQLQTVVIAPGRNAAIINGVMVKIGDKYGDAVLERVAEDRIVLRSGTSRQELRLHPGVEKVGMTRVEPVAPAVEKSAPPKAKSQAKPKAKATAKPEAKAPSGVRPAADGSAGAR